jgi:biopolymer transport protein ExbB
MIQAFTVLMAQGAAMGTTWPRRRSSRRREARTSIPSLAFYRYFLRRVDDLTITMEQEASKLVEIMHGEREIDPRQ